MVSAASEEDSSASSDAATSSVSAVREVAAAVSAVKNGWVTENGSTYYYINSVKKTDSFLTQDGKVYYFGDDGKEYKNQFYHNWGRMYYFGDDGARYTNQFYSNWGRMYYFGNDGARYTNQFYSNWGRTYYFGNDGARYTNQFYSNWGRTYYFGDDGARYTNQFYSNWGRTYYFGDDGARYTNQFYSNWGRTYYFGNDGARWTNQFMSAWGNIYYFGSDGARATSTTINLGYGDLTFDNKGILTSSNSFIGGIVNGAIEGWLDYGVLPSLTIAQAILESGWGNSVLAYKYHNLFGIKGSYNGNSVALPTYEVYNGVTYYITDYFRVYPSNNASIHDHALFFVENSRYANLLGNISASAVTTLVRRDGYATDPSYSTSLMSLINNYGLTRYDQIAFSAKAK
ncbi:glucosaminidase domain-containing protein [Limosilactobacillus fermentum]|uniref:glucosaminidase domain-containing protein n=1 Tax=Limosilactobacillus fermentum TaxID=1613 RepID=UPI00301DF344